MNVPNPEDSSLEQNLSGPSKARRYSALELLLERATVDPQVIRILLDAESVQSNINESRDKERHLELLLKELRSDKSVSSKLTHVYAFRYLLGSLYINFERFWGPTVRIIIELLNQSKFQKSLSEILLQHLIETNDYIYDDDKRNDSELLDDRPDHILHRNFILQILSKFVSHVESQGTIFMDQFFRFVYNELMVSPFIEKFTRCDLTQQDVDLSKQEEVMQLDEPVFDVGTIRNGNKRRKSDPFRKIRKKVSVPESVLRKRKSRETLITATKIIQAFRDIKLIHRQSELKILIEDLLCCRDSSVQKAAFNCLLAYEMEDLKPYIDKILRIIDDKKSRTELSMFSIDAEESEQVQFQHRAKLIPLLQRILFGRMIGQVGKKSSGHDKADLRKTLIMRFIAGCTVEEILGFFKLLFDPLFPLIDVPYGQIESVSAAKLDLKSYVPSNKMQAMLGSLSAYMEHVANLKEESLPYVLKMIIIIIHQVVTPLEDPDLVVKIASKNVESLKVLRRGCVSILTNFFKSFEYYQFHQEEINIIFKLIVWPSSRDFIARNHATVTPILKMIEVFSNNLVYHRLLVKKRKENRDECLLDHLMNLYQDVKTQRPVLKFLASIIANILKPERNWVDDDDLEEERERYREIPMLEDEDSLVPSYNSQLNVVAPVAFGHQMLMNYIPVIFDRLRRNCEELITKKDSSYSLESEELLILTTLSEYIEDSDQSLVASKLLLTTLSHQHNGKLIINTLKTTEALMKQVLSNPDPIIVDNIANILSYQRNVEQRVELCNLLDILAKMDTKLTSACQAIRLMNSTSSHIVDAPDLAQWSEGFRIAFEYLDQLDENLINQPTLVRDSIILLVHQTCFIINNVDRYEFSVRENCYVFFEKLSKRLSLVSADSNKRFLQHVLNDMLLEKFIRKGLRESNDAIKHTYITVIRSLATNCHDKNRILGEFSMFCNPNEDLDFWLNIKHIQLHNRSKALARLISNENLEKVSPKTLSCYFMPLAAGFLFNKNYKSIATLSENSIKLIGIICKNINWVTYESTLSFYLNLLTKANATYQRTNVKLITEILKNFNFDITACDEAMENKEENDKLEERMKKRLGVNIHKHQGSETLVASALNSKKLNPSTARMVFYAVTKKLIPKLTSCLHEMTHVELEHDKNMANYMPEKDEIKRIPLAYAIVQLLNLLPCRYVLFRDQLPALFLKLAGFLKSKNEDTRKAARMTLIKVMNFVGPAYLPDLLRILKQNLDKGFHIHVLTYTIHSVMDKLTLNYGDIDSSVGELVDSCFQEIFGRPSEDKDIAQVIAKTPEAKKTKSYDTLLIISSHVSVDKLDYLLGSVKSLLKTSTESKKVNKLSVCLQRIFTGLSQNKDFPLDDMLNFIYNTIEESIPSLKIRQKVDQAENSKNPSDPKAPLREDRFLIARELTKDRIKSKINEKGNIHMLVENSLRLLLLVAENNKSSIRKDESLQKRLDCFIEILPQCLKSSSPRCVMRALKCIHFIAQTKSDLASLKTTCNSIVKKIFILLSLYNGVGMVQGDNYEMIGMCFKTLTLLLLKCEHANLNELQIKALLSYIEQDLHDTSRQATAFGTLHSLLRKNCYAPELADIMNKVADLLVTSADDSVRSLSIKIWQTYLLDYKHEPPAIQSYLTKFLRQIDYEFIDGRRSVLKMLRVVVEKFSEKLLGNYFDLFFHLLAQRVVNDESKDLRATVGRLIALLLQRSPDKQAYVLNKFVLPWAHGKDVHLKILGIKLISIVLEASRALFEKNKDRISKTLEVIRDALEFKTCSKRKIVSPEREQNEEAVDISDDNAEKVILQNSIEDKLSYSSLRLLKRLLDYKLVDCVEVRYIDKLKKIWHIIASEKLTSSHEPTILTSCELYLFFIMKTDLHKSLKVENPTTDNYLDWNSTRIVRLLCDKYIDLLDRFDPTNKIFSYVTQSMISLGQMVTNSIATLDFEQKYLEKFGEGGIVDHLLSLDALPSDGFVHDHLPYELNEAKRRADLMWLSIKIVNQARKEAALFRLASSHRRDFVLRWTAAVAQELGPRRIAPYVFLFTMTPVRELTDKLKSKPDEGVSRNNIVAMSEDLLKFMKSLLGVELFNKIYSKVQMHYTRKRVERKKAVAMFKVRDQTRGVKRQLRQRKDKDAKRRKSKVEARKSLNGRNGGNKRLRT